VRGHSRTPTFDKRKYPLRKVVERDIKADEYRGIKGNWWLNLLECGHKIPAAKDFYGDIHSEKQRCRFCYEEKLGSN